MRALTLFGCGLVALSLHAGDTGKKLPVPSEAAQARALALVLDIFKEDIDSAKTPQAKAKLAANLLQQGKESRDDAANRYVLYREALRLAAQAGAPALTLLAVEEMAGAYALNVFELKATALTAVAEHVSGKEASKAVVDLVLPLIAEAQEADNYEAAFAFGKVAETAARRSKVLAS